MRTRRRQDTPPTAQDDIKRAVRSKRFDTTPHRSPLPRTANRIREVAPSLRPIYYCIIGTAPSYLAETLYLTADVGSRRRLLSASTSTLVIPSTRRTTLGDRAYPVTAARAWNALPSSVRSTPSLLQFRRDLKTALHVSVVLFTIVSSCVTDCNF